ncbi:MAG: hypothetical protein LBC59_05835 [Chitinispirillales bacterium]|nr:hypothetical protein [Chitinispirillales bacterium]
MDKSFDVNFKVSILSKLLMLAIITLFIVTSPTAFADGRDNAGYNPMIRPDDRINRFVQRAYSRYGILPKGFHRQPMGTADFLNYLDTLSTLPVSAEERYTLEMLRGYLSVDKGLYGFRGGEETRNGGDYRDNQNQYGLIINLDLNADAWSKSGGGIGPRVGGRGIIGPQLRGHIGRVSFYSSLDVWTEYVYDSLFMQTSYQPYDGVPYELYGRYDKEHGGNVRSSDLPRCGVVFDAGRISLQGGIDYLRLGPAAYFPLTLSGNAPPITYARGIFDLTYVEYHHTVGILRSQRDKSKYIYSNGLVGNLWGGRVRWGISEVMIGGSTTNQQDDDPANTIREEYVGQELGWEEAFFVPFVPMVFVEHYVGDKNNAALALDATVNWPKDFRFYFEFFLDDMLAPWKIMSDDWGNKWALTIGAQYFANWKNRDVSVGLEISRVEPWVYTHFYGGSHRYDHFNVCLGSAAGPNSLSAVVNGDISVTEKVTLGVRVASLSNNPSARGGKITDIFQDEGRGSTPDAGIKKFLGPGTVSYIRPGLYGRYDPFGLFRVNAGIDVDVAEERGRVSFSLDGGFRF